MTQYAFMVYHRADDNMFETCLKTLRNHSTCNIVVATDNVAEESRLNLSREYGVQWIVMDSELMENRRAACKLEQLELFVKTLKEGDSILVSDVDIYFLADPFTAIGDFDIGLTTRGYEYYFPINGGVFYIVCNERSMEWLRWHVAEIHEMTWLPYVVYSYNHRTRFGLDWAVGQDFLVACWEERDWIEREKGIRIVDVGPRYNYCPPSDKWGLKAFEAIRKAYRDKSVVALHLKSTLKDILYEGLFPDAVTKHPRCSNDWFIAGKST
jgi:hypothetical protein